MEREHILKLPEPYWTAVASGEKMFEIRRNDRGYQKGDLILVDTSGHDCNNLECTMRRAPMYRTVTYVFSGDPQLRDCGGILPGYVILGLSE